MVTGAIPITTSPVPAYATEDEWRDKYGISTTDESAGQFVIDLREAHFQVRREAYYLVRERIITMDSDKKSWLPRTWLTDGTMNGTVDKNDLLVYQLNTNGREFDTVSLDEVTSVDTFNNYIQFDSGFAPTRQLYVTYYSCGKPFDEIVIDEIKRGVMAYVTILCIKRLRQKWGLKGSTGWSAGGVTVSKDTNSYDDLIKEAEADYKKFISFMKPFVGKRAKTGAGGANFSYDPSIAYSSQVFPAMRTGRNFRY